MRVALLTASDLIEMILEEADMHEDPDTQGFHCPGLLVRVLRNYMAEWQGAAQEGPSE